jgi:hypothetical protein
MKIAYMLFGMAMLAAAAALADPVLTALPGTIDGNPGSTIGWGYSIFNDTTDWYLPTSISTPSFADGTPVVLFDYPAVAPGATVTEDYNGSQGLLELTLSAAAPVGAQDIGDVVLSGDYFDSDPFTNPQATDLGSAPNAIAPINATVVAATTVPEPSLLWVLIGLCFGLLMRGSYRRFKAPTSGGAYPLEQ